MSLASSALVVTAIVNVFSRVPTFEFTFSVYGFFSRWNVPGPLITCFRKYVLGNSRFVVGVSFSGRTGALVSLVRYL